jgi:hypothetical protein
VTSPSLHPKSDLLGGFSVNPAAGNMFVRGAREVE